MSCHHRLAQRLRRAVRRWLVRWRVCAWEVSTVLSSVEFTTLSLESMLVSITVKPSMKSHPVLRIKPLNAEGEVVPLPKPPSWRVNDPGFKGSLNPSADGLSCVVLKPVPYVECEVRVTASADPLTPATWTIVFAPDDADHFEASSEMVPDEEQSPTSTDTPAEPKATDEHQVVS